MLTLIVLIDINDKDSIQYSSLHCCKKLVNIG